MGFCQASEVYMKVLYSRLSNSTLYAPSYSARVFRRTSFPNTRNFKPFLSAKNVRYDGARAVSRRYYTGMPVSDHMELIKELRERTCAPIKDVKSSLVSCNWDIESAQKDLRKKGVILASRKSSRTAAEGLIALAESKGKTAVIELNCETDFVARNEIFQYMALSLAKLALFAGSSCQQFLELSPEHIEDLNIKLDHPKLSNETTVRNAISEIVAVTGENIRYRRGYVISASSRGIVSSYLHTSPTQGLGGITGIVALETDADNFILNALQQVGSELAMHIVAAKPLFLSREHVTAEALESEREILKLQAEASGKSQMAIEKMVDGRLRKYFEDVVLMEQKFVVQETVTVKDVLDKLSKEIGCNVKIANFLRMEVGEGIERFEASNAPKVAAGAS